MILREKIRLMLGYALVAATKRIRQHGESMDAENQKSPQAARSTPLSSPPSPPIQEGSAIQTQGHESNVSGAADTLSEDMAGTSPPNSTSQKSAESDVSLLKVISFSAMRVDSLEANAQGRTEALRSVALLAKEMPSDVSRKFLESIRAKLDEVPNSAHFSAMREGIRIVNQIATELAKNPSGK